MLISFADEYDALAAEFVWGWGANPPIYLFFFCQSTIWSTYPPLFCYKDFSSDYSDDDAGLIIDPAVILSHQKLSRMVILAAPKFAIP